METSVEKQQYNISKYWHWSLRSSHSVARDISYYNPKLDDYKDVLQIAEDLGFLTGHIDLPTKKGRWKIYEGVNYPIPNFPEGETRVNSEVGFYFKKDEDNPRSMILKLSEEPMSTIDFVNDLEKFTKYYVERPQYLGFPSAAMADNRQYLTTIPGFVGGGIWGYSVSVPNIAGGVLAGIAGGCVTGLIGIAGVGAAEYYSKRRLPDLTPYFAGNAAKEILLKQLDHLNTVIIQKELYSYILEKGSKLTPGWFLDEVYSQIPSNIIEWRKKELGRARHPKNDSSPKPEIAFMGMMAVADLYDFSLRYK